MRRAALGAAAGAILGAVVAVVVGEMFALSSFYPGLSREVSGAGVAATVGGIQGLVWSLGSSTSDRGPRALLVIGGGCAVFVYIVIARAWTMWIDLSVFGAGPAGRLALVALPFSEAIAGAVLGSSYHRSRPLRAPPSKTHC